VRRRTLAPIIAVLLLLAACDDSGSDEPRGGGAGGKGGAVTIFAPPGLTRPLEVLTTVFQKEAPGATFEFTFGRKKELQQRMQRGNPPDLYIDDSGAMESVANSDQAQGPPVDVGFDLMQLVVPKGNPKGVVEGLAAFGNGSPVVSGLCERTLACGYAATQVLGSAGVSPAPDVVNPNATDLLQAVVRGEVDVALLYRTEIRPRFFRTSVLQVPSANNVRVDYQVVLLRSDDTARRFVEWVQGSENSRRVLQVLGLLPLRV
jgi:molybdate transport system substrate-binding protein